MNINRIFFTLCFLTLFSCSKEKTTSFYVVYTSGNSVVSFQNTKRNLNAGDLFDLQEIKEIHFESGFAIFQSSKDKLILPRAGKKTYTKQDLINEFENSDKNINQQYLSYITKKIIKKKQNPKKGDVIGSVSRGQSFITNVLPFGNYESFGDSINFSWQTNLRMDTLNLKIINSEFIEIKDITIAPSITNVKVNFDDIDYEDQTLFWQIFMKGDNPKYNAWSPFKITKIYNVGENYSNANISELNLDDQTTNELLNLMN